MNRSFVIPVIDYSPASEYNIKTLLSDLENIEGYVIVIFNSEKVADEIKSHPRIDYYAVMKKNVGVARAWNIGLNISHTPVTFILNSDLHLGRESVETIEKGLLAFPDAAMAGPQGSYNNISRLEDIEYFDKGTFSEITEVDAVSGFYFAVKTEYFQDGVLKFENKFTPCYFEEWDIGLQIKKAGLKSYVVPTVDYTHHWSGSIRSMKTVKYLDREETIAEIHNRNSKEIIKKWTLISKNSTSGAVQDYLVSNWFAKSNKQALDYLQGQEFAKSAELFTKIVKEYPNYSRGYYFLGLLSEKNSNFEEAKLFFQKALELEPDFSEARDKFSNLTKNG